MFYKFVYVIHLLLRFVIWSLLIFYLLASRVANIVEKQVSKFIDFYFTNFFIWICGSARTIVFVGIPESKEPPPRVTMWTRL